MKRILTLTFVLLFSATLFAQGYTEIKPSQLPKKITNYFKKDLPGFTILRAAQALDNGELKFGVVAESKGRKSVFVFDRYGNYLDRVRNLNDLKSKEQKKESPPSKK